jgi:hypothetical protein
MSSGSSKSDTLINFASVMIPDLQESENEKGAFLLVLNRFFLSLDRPLRRKLDLLLQMVNFLSFFYNGRSFNRLSYSQKCKYIDRLFEFPVNTLISGLTGLRTLCFFAYYTDADQWKKINYEGPIKRA